MANTAFAWEPSSFQHLGGGLTSELHINALLFRRHRALHHEEELFSISLDRRAERLLRLFAGAGHQGLVVVERNDAEDELVHTGK